MKSPRYKEGQRVKLSRQYPLELQADAAPLESSKSYTISHHIWRGGKWYVSFTELGPLSAYEEIGFTHYESYLTA